MKLNSDTINTFFKNSQISPEYLKNKQIIVPTEDKEAYSYLESIRQNISQFVKEGRNLYLCSNYVGNGKTQWACDLAKEYILNKECGSTYNCPVLFINVPRFLADLKTSISDEKLRDYTVAMTRIIKTAELVIFDDFADAVISEFDYANLYSWIDYRISYCKSNIYTTNTMPDDLINCMPAKLVDRVLGKSKKIVLNAGSFREEE